MPLVACLGVPPNGDLTFRLTFRAITMDDPSARDFFLVPSSPCQRQYEALRSVFIDGLSQKDAAARFGYSYGAFRLLVLQFRNQLRQGLPTPFFSPHGGMRPYHPNRRPDPAIRSSRPSPMSAV